MIGLEDILIVDLYKAIESDNPKVIDKNMTYEQFEDIVQLYIDVQKNDNSVSELRILKLTTKVKIARSCLYVLRSQLMDESMMKILNELNLKITKDNYPFDLVEIDRSLTSLEKKIKILKDNQPDDLKKKKEKSNVTIYDILASMSTNLDGIYLNPKTITVREFVSYKNVLERKQESYEKLKNKK